MSIYDIHSLPELLKNNTYPGRGITVGLSENGKYAVAVYFIMGRSENSRNRVFERQGDTVTIYPFDPSKVEDPSLIIYSPVRQLGEDLIVTNGDQTDTAYDLMAQGKTFAAALSTRAFEPDAPNFTPRISAVLHLHKTFGYEMNILKSADEKGSACNRYNFVYEPICGLGHFLHTYNHDGNPIPTFTGEPERVAIPNDIDAFADAIWANLNPDNKVSMYICYTDLATGERTHRLFNRHSK